MSLKGKVAIATGGSRGIGAGIAKELGKRGAKVLVTFAFSSLQANEVVKAINSTGDAIAIEADCLDSESPQLVISTAVKAFGEKIDIIVNNAGVGDELYLEDITLEHFDKVMYTNVPFPILLLQKALPYLQRGGRIVNLSSAAARQGNLESLARTYTVELGHKYGITINAVNPVAVATVESEPGIEHVINTTPAAPRVGEVDDVDQVVAFLCDEGSRWITGTTVGANGGTCPM